MTSDRRTLRLLLALVVVVRLLFLNQAMQGDDVNYLKGAEHALLDPLHPTHATYAFQGRVVSMLGHPHPPLNAWCLALLLAVFGDVEEAKFHALYTLFSLLAVWAAWRLAARFSPRPGWAALLFGVTPAFLVNGGSLEADVPFVAFWLASIALFVRAADERSPRWLLASIGAQALAALAAFQAVVLVPVLAVYLWLNRRDWKAGWIAAFTAPAVILAWQAFERLTSGALPAAVLGGYLQSYGLQTLTRKLQNAGALTAHLAWLVFPVLAVVAFLGRRRLRLAILPLVCALGAAFLDPHPLFWGSFGIGVLVLVAAVEIGWRPADPDDRFLALWIVIFFAAALAIFFAGSARYLLPVVLPLAILVTRRVSRTGWLAAGAALNLALALGLALVNYQQWGAYQRFAGRVLEAAGNSRVWINAEWGLRYYLEAGGGLPYLLEQEVRPGDWIVSSDLCEYARRIPTGGGRPVEVARAEVRSWVPLRIIALDSKSGYSSAAFGLRPFDLALGGAPIDRLRAETILEAQPTLSALPMNAPEAARHLVSGIYDLEGGGWRWMTSRGVVILKSPARGPARVALEFYIPDAAPGRRVTLSAGDTLLADRTYPGPGSYRLEAPLELAADSVTLTITIDQTLTPPGDQRKLGMILRSVALEPR